MGEQNNGVAPSIEMNAAPEKVVKVRKDKSNLYGVLILLIVLLIAAAGFVFLQQLRSEQQGLGGALDKGDRRIGVLHEQLASLESQMSTMQKKMATLESNLETRESKFERQLAEFKQHHGSQLSATKSELVDSIGKIQSLLNKTRGDWMIADAEYLLGVAIQRLNLVGDVRTSLVALNAADERLRDSGDPGVFPVREQVAREIDALRKVKALDLVGLFSRIRILEDQVAVLPTRLPHAEIVQKEFIPPGSDKKAGEISGVNDWIDTAFKDLKGLVQIRRSDQPILTVLHPEEVRIIREELRVKLGLVRLALVEHDSRLFISNIDECMASLKTHFRVDAAETRQFEAELQALKSVGLDLDYPNITGSLELLQKLAVLRVDSEKAKAQKTQENKGATPLPGAAGKANQQGAPR